MILRRIQAPQRATWDEIVSSGHLDFLPAGAVEAGLSQYYAFDGAQDLYRMGKNSAYRQTARKIIPIGPLSWLVRRWRSTRSVISMHRRAHLRNWRRNTASDSHTRSPIFMPGAARKTSLSSGCRPRTIRMTEGLP